MRVRVLVTVASNPKQATPWPRSMRAVTAGIGGLLECCAGQQLLAARGNPTGELPQPHTLAAWGGPLTLWDMVGTSPGGQVLSRTCLDELKQWFIPYVFAQQSDRPANYAGCTTAGASRAAVALYCTDSCSCLHLPLSPSPQAPRSVGFTCSGKFCLEYMSTFARFLACVGSGWVHVTG
jgi:hypothetical protein